MEKLFKEVAANESNPNWEGLIRRETKLYGHSDDIRSPFARDCNRVLHSLAYRRLKHKTQLFYNAAGNDHICTRIEHVHHVASVSETISATLGLNVELTTAIALSHDLGHAPFGHQGEVVISKITEKYLGERFWHEKNGVYFVDNIELLEDLERNYRNLNLTYAVRDGIISHCGEVDQNEIFPRKELMDLSEIKTAGLHQAATWEGCVVKIADKIAYLGRDIEDATRLGYLSKTEKALLKEIAERYDEYAINSTVLVNNLIKDICQNSTPGTGLSLSKKMFEQISELRKFNYEHIIKNKRLDTYVKYSQLVINELFEVLLDYYNLYRDRVIFELSDSGFDNRKFVKDFAKWLVQYVEMDFRGYEWAEKISERCTNKKIYGTLSSEKQYIRAVLDFIAGMTDVYALNAFDELLKC